MCVNLPHQTVGPLRVRTEFLLLFILSTHALRHYVRDGKSDKKSGKKKTNFPGTYCLMRDLNHIQQSKYMNKIISGSDRSCEEITIRYWDKE